MEESEKIKISDIGHVVTGKTPRTSIKENYGGYIPFLTPSDDLSNKFAPITNKALTDKGLMEVRNCLLPKNSICVSCIGSDLGKVVMLKKPTVTNQQFNSIIPNENYSPDFVYYLMIIVGKRLNFLSKTSTAVPIINKSTFSNFEVEVPSCLHKQTQIAKILSSLDDKIELNNRINANLEEQAQALFRRWFVDFEFPNDQGLPYKSNGGSFVDSELGRIPEGWTVSPLLNFCTEIVRGNIPTYVKKSNHPILNQKVNKGTILDKQYYKYNDDSIIVSCNKLAHKGDILLNSLGQGTLGRIHLYKDDVDNVIVDQFITILRTDSFIKSAYLAYMLNSLEYQNMIESNVTGSTGMWVLTINNIRKIKIIEPNKLILNRLRDIISYMYKSISINIRENENLSSLRDSLLPKLMNNEIEIH